MTELRDKLQRTLTPVYAIERELGGGGMARVFVAEEVALGRRVVVKVLPPELTEGLSAERFTREIRFAATMQHANIVPLLSTGAVDGLPYYTMPYVDGESLRARLARDGTLSVGETVAILRDVARALAYAHARGVVHRDIKPENVLLSGGAAVVTDFGIAKAIATSRTNSGDWKPGDWGQGTGDSAHPGVPTRGERHPGRVPSPESPVPAVVPLTVLGVAIGTPAYMAPEQAAGDVVDARTDVYALGCVAYEMLTGTPPFTGRAPLLLLAAHAGEAPEPVAQRRRDVPMALAQLVDRCLAKRPGDRPANGEAVVRLLDSLGSGESPASRGRSGTRQRSTTLIALAGAGVVATAAIAAFVMTRSRVPPPLGAGTAVQVTASPELELDVAISPDGRMLAYTTPVGGGFRMFRLFVRQLSGGRTVMVGPDSGGNQRWPRWSPDGFSLLYSSEGIVYQIPALGGAPRPIVGSRGTLLRSNPTAAISPDGRQVAWADSAGILIRDLGGGPSRRVATGPELNSPAWSPDGRMIAYVAGNRSYVNVVANTSPSTIWTVALGGGVPHRITESLHLNTSPVWLPHGRGLLFVSNAGGLRDVWQVAVRADGAAASGPTRLTTGLEPYTISLSGDGRYLAYTVLRLRSNIWSAPISPTATTAVAAARQVTSENQLVEGVSVSRDGKWLTYDANRHGNADVFRIPASGGEAVQLTTDAADDFQPVWSADGTRLAFYSTRTGTRDVYVMDPDGGSLEHVTALPGEERFPTWSPDGNRLAFASNATGTEEVYTATRGADGRWSAAERLTTTGVGYPRWSPDGRTISGVSQGRAVVLPASGGDVRVLVDPRASGGNVVFTDWGSDSSVLYYLTIDPRRFQYRFWSVPADGGNPRVVLELDAAARQAGGITFSTDGRQLFYTVSTNESDVWTMELIK